MGLLTDFTLAVLIGCCVLAAPTAGRPPTASARNDAAPKGCKWQRQSPLLLDDGADANSENAASIPAIKHALVCKLRTIGGIDALIGNMSVYQTDRIAGLRLECSDVLFFESSLEASQHSGAFLGSLRNLRDLRVEFCKIRHVPSMVLRGLRDLRTLSLRTHNADWAAMHLDLHPESFRGLTELRELDLANNNLWSMPPDVFCPLFSLKTLNLTVNRLKDIGQLGFSDWSGASDAHGAATGHRACITGLETLDLSHNHITTVPDNALSAVRSLTHLLLQDNLLTAIPDRAFFGLPALAVLNMSSNRLIALPPELFQTPRALRQLHLQNNTLSVLAPGLLEGLARLEVLDLSQNELSSTWVNRDTFAGLMRLVVLNLGYNALTVVDATVFRGLYSLQILNLEHNAIATIANNAFADLRNLHALTLSHNRLKSVDAFHLAELYVLNQLFLDSNQIAAVDSRAFENVTNLSDLSLNDNQLTEVPPGLQKLRQLKSLDLGKNRIQSIANHSFAGLEQLLGLRLTDNQLTNISRDAFRPLNTVHVLNLASNQIRHIDPAAFAANPTLRAIRLDDNRLEDIAGVFNALPALVWLNVSANRLRWFDYSHLPVSLEWLDMHQNNVTELANYYDVRNQLQIKMLDVSHNQLGRIDEASLPDTIETLYLNNNNLVEVAAGTFLKKRNIEKVVLYGNAIKTLDIGAFALAGIADGREMPTFYIGNNPIHCDCRMEWLQRINELSHLRQHPRVLDLDAVQCTMEHERGEALRPLMDLRSQDFLCAYESHCFELCHCCEYEACDCNMQCPDRCSCYHDHTWSTNVVDCGQADYADVPERLPMHATAIYLDGNRLGNLSGNAFLGKKKLEMLYLNNSHIVSVHNRTFNGVPALKVVHLEHNRLTELRGFEFEQLPNLSELYLDHNAIAHVGERTFAGMRQLEVLSLGDNRIEAFAPWQQLAGAVESGSLQQVRLHGMKWRCDCASLGQLQDWLRDINGGEFDVNQMICTDDRIVGEALRGCAISVVSGGGGAGGVGSGGNGVGGSSGGGNGGHSDGAVATPAVQRNVLIGNGLIGGGYVPLMAAILVAVIGTALIIALACIFRQDVRLWAHAKYGVRLFKDPTMVIPAADVDGEKMYDAYLVYSVRDADFAAQIVAGELQHSGYNMCLHHRDIHAATYLSDSLQSAADASKKIVLIVSMNFLQCEWSQPQFRLALQTVIENIRPAYRSHKLVLVLTAPIEIITMDPVMSHLVQSCPVVCWGEKRFWDKLRFSLPDISHSRTLQKMGAGGGSMSRSPNLRYTAAPTSTTASASTATIAHPEVWYKQHPGMAMPVTIGVLPPQPPTMMPMMMTQSERTGTPSHSHSHSQLEDDSSCASSQHYEAPPVLMMQQQQQVPVGGHSTVGQPNYVCRSSASSLGHVYSTIPETSQNGPAYFV